MLKIIRFKKKLNESQMILESLESKSIAAAKKLWLECEWKNCKYSDEEFNNYINLLRGAIPVLRSKEGGKYILACTRMCINNQFNYASDFSVINNILKIIVSSHNDEYDRNLNGMTFFQLKRKFGKDIKFNLEKLKELLRNMLFSGKSDYEIVRIESFEQAKKYHDYTDWCITYKDDMWDNYTLEDTNVFYFILKKGYENVEKKCGENCPNDEYGLSMIAVSVCPDGSINSSTCRWNHDNGGTDSLFDYVLISKLILRNFFDVLKPKEVEKSKDDRFNAFVREHFIGKSILELDKKELEQYNVTLHDMGKNYIIRIGVYLNILFLNDDIIHRENDDIIRGVVFPTWIKHKTNADLIPLGRKIYGYMNDEREFSVYSVENDVESVKIFGPVECIGFTRNGICVNNDYTITIYDNHFIYNKNSRKWTSTWKLTMGQIKYIYYTTILQSPILKFKENEPDIIRIEFIMTKSESLNVPDEFKKFYSKFYDFKTGRDLFPDCKILKFFNLITQRDNDYRIEYLDKDNNLKSGLVVLEERNEDGTLKIEEISENLNMKTMTQLCESIMDDLDVQTEVTAAQTIVKNAKMTSRLIEDFPYMFMFIMWDKRYLYKDRQKIKKDVEAFLGQFRPITEYSPIVFDKDPEDTTFSFGFDHSMRTVTLFYRMFTGVISYMRNYITAATEYEFIVKDFSKDRELCRMNSEDVVLFTNILKNRSLGNDKDEAGKQMGYLQETCVELLGLSWKEVSNQMARLFNVHFQYHDKYDDEDEDRGFVINKVFLNEGRQTKTMTELCESIMDDLERNEIPAAQKLANLLIVRYTKVRDSVLSLLTAMKKVNKIVDNLKSISDEDKKCFHIYGKLYSSTNQDADTYYFNADINQEEIIDMCKFLYNSYGSTVDSEFLWIFDESDRMDEFYEKLVILFDELDNLYSNDRHKSVTLQSKYDMNYMEFNDYQPVKLINEMKKWVNKVYKPFILSNFSDDVSEM